MSQFLIVGDVDRIQDYVFGSIRLRAIRGASALLDFAANEVKDNLPNIDILRWRGGQIVAVLEDGTSCQARSICAQIEKLFRSKSAGEATITTTYEPYPAGTFRDTLKKAFRTIRREKDGAQLIGRDSEAFLSSPYDRRCDFLPSQSATRQRWVGESDDTERYLLSEPADKRWKAVESNSPFDNDLKEELKNKGRWYQEDFRFPYRPEDLWPSGSEGQYLALSMADGNAFGQMLETIEDQTTYKAYSEELYQLIIAAIAEAIQKTGIKPFKKPHRHEVQTWLPCIPIILAGDDLSVLVRDEHALAFTGTGSVI